MRLYFLLWLSTIVLFSCHSGEGQKKTANQDEPIISVRLSDTSWITNQNSIHAIIERINNDAISLSITNNGEAIMTDILSGTSSVKPVITDFNTDGYTDILLPPYLYLYEKQKNSFVFVEGLKDYPEPVQLTSNPSYYYSYEAAGCNQMNWKSDLFKIEAYKTVKIGHLYAKGCTDNVLENPQMIGVYNVSKVNDQSEELVEKLPYLKHISGDTTRQEFLEKYWNSNYRKFE
jgi:hypothetical protein